MCNVGVVAIPLLSRNLQNLPRIRLHQVTDHLSRGEPAAKIIPSRLQQRLQGHAFFRQSTKFFCLLSELSILGRELSRDYPDQPFSSACGAFTVFRVKLL